ncbi:MAG TPA: serine hydrolase [Thermoanaerobaculia bacterium]|jgi:beta-lactamase class A|nr:serine hydrolase [Thermoanaerobaculia bacterium]
MKSVIMLFPISLFLLACATTGAKPAAAPTGSLDSRLQPYYQRKGVTIAVAYRNLGTGATYFHEEETSLHAASTMKVPVMMALFQAVDSGELGLAEPIPVRNEFQSIVDGSKFSLDPKEDGDPDLYQALGQSRPLEELIRRMIVRSSNLATNLLIEKIGASRANDLMRSLGAYRIQVLRGVEDEKAFNAGLNNKVTAKDLEIALTALAKGETFKPASNEKMIEILKAQEFNEKIPAFLPKGTPIAHKTGDITGIHHDAAIVYPPGEPPYVLVVLTGGIQDEKEADRVIAEISRVVWQGRGLK